MLTLSRKKFLLGMGVLVLFSGGIGAILVLLVRHEPGFYRRTTLPPSTERRQAAQRLTETFTREIVNPVVNDKKAWGAEFTEREINSWLQEELVRSGLGKSLPGDIQEPRIAIEADRLRLGFRYGKGLWSSVITVIFRPRLARGDPSVVVLELHGLRAGLLPISAQSLLDRISNIARENDLKISWYRQKHLPVAVLRFPPTVQFKQLDFQDDKFSIRGGKSDRQFETEASEASTDTAGEKQRID